MRKLTSMAPRKRYDWRQQKKNVRITERVTANTAKTYVYGYKEQKRLAAVIDTNLYINECMPYVLPEPETFTIIAASNSYFLTFAFWCMSVFVLHTVYFGDTDDLGTRQLILKDCAPLEMFSNSLRTPAPVTRFTVDGRIDDSAEVDDSADEVDGTLPRTLKAWIQAQKRRSCFT